MDKLKTKRGGSKKVVLVLMRFTIIIAAFAFLFGCASKHKRLLSVPVGLNKRQVLRQFSDPIETYRSSKGFDNWVYESTTRAKNTREKLLYTHTLRFENGLLIKKDHKRTFTTKEMKEFKKE